MLKRKNDLFLELVYEAAARLGENPPVIADAIIKSAFPETANAAEREGADAMLRDGVIARIRNILSFSVTDNQGDFAEIREDFRPVACRLHKRRYYVPSKSKYLTVAEMIETPSFILEAANHLFAHAKATKAEGDTLIELHAAVTSK